VTVAAEDLSGQVFTGRHPRTPKGWGVSCGHNDRAYGAAAGKSGDWEEFGL
jgi:hypothetical protein